MRLFDYADLLENWEQTINRYAMQKVEFGASGVAEKVAEIEALLKQKVAELDALPNDAALEKAEPDDLPSILALRPPGGRRIQSSLSADFRDRLEGAWLGRCAGCTLGSIVEGWKVEQNAKVGGISRRPIPAGGLLESGGAAAFAQAEGECAP